MASVSITPPVIDEIKKSIRAARDKELRDAGVPLNNTLDFTPPEIQEIKAAIEAFAWEPVEDIRSRIREAWVKKTPLNWSVKFILSEGQTVAHPTVYISGPATKYGSVQLRTPEKDSGSWTHDLPLDRAPACLRDRVASVQALGGKTTREKWDAVETAVLAVLNSKATLNAACKELPGLLVFVPQQRKSRMA